MLKLFLILLTSLTFAQSPFWKMELMENETAPSTPRNIAAVGDANKITLTWTDPSQSDFDSVRVYAGTSANPTTWVASVAKGVQSYVDTNYSYNTIRHYRLKALTTSGDTSNYTSSVNDTVLAYLGSNIITNSDFSTNITGWTALNSTAKWYSSDYNSIGRFNCALDSAGGGANNAIIGTYAFLNTTRYRLTYDYYISSGNTTTNRIMPSLVGGSYPNLTIRNVVGTWTQVSEDFTSDGAYTSIRFYHYPLTTTAGDKIYIDNVSVKQILNP